MTVSVVTGATSGIGRAIALGLAEAGHVVVVVSRDRARGEAALSWIAGRAATARLELVLADLALLGATRQAGETIRARHGSVDVLVNNAGVFCTAREETAEGHERVIATNHLAPFVLTRALLPALEAAATRRGVARIVNIGSDRSETAQIDPADLEGRQRWGMVRAYGQSKLALTMATIGWAERTAKSGVVANVVHPGLVATSLIRAHGPVGLAWRLMAPFALTVEQGADTPLHVALSTEFAAISGAYVKRRHPHAPNPLALKPALVAQVWQATEALVAAS